MANEDAIRNVVREAVRRALSETDLAKSLAADQSPATYRAPWTGIEYEAHPSRRQFNIDEASLNLGGLLEFVENELCSIEKGKTCDHCGMCRTLGF
jgi:hypothetical protein